MLYSSHFAAVCGTARMKPIMGFCPVEDIPLVLSVNGTTETSLQTGSALAICIMATTKTKMHVTEMNERDALRVLKLRPTHVPFALKVSLFATHAEDDNLLQ
jgi:hypothetical protein